MNKNLLAEEIGGLLQMPESIPQMRHFILDLAIRGKLMPQNSKDESAAKLLTKIAVEKKKLVRAGKIKPSADLPPIADSEIPFAIPNGWEWVRFSDLAFFAMGKTPPRKESIFWNSPDYSWVSISDMEHGGSILKTKYCVSESARENIFRKLPLSAGTLLMSFKLTIGKISRLAIPAYHNEGIISIYTYIKIMEDFLFVFLPLFSQFGQKRDAVKGKTLNMKSLSMILIALPPLAEQKRIVAKVNQLMACCDKLEEAQKKEEGYRERFLDSVLHELTDTSKSFGKSADFALSHFSRLTLRAKDIKVWRKSILDLAVRGKLVPQNSNDESAAKLLVKIAAEKKKLVRAGKIRPSTDLPPIVDDEIPFTIPKSWEWVNAVYPCYLVSDKNKKIKTSEIKKEGLFPVVDQGKQFVRGYSDNADRVIKVKDSIILFGDHTKQIKLIDFDFIVGADGVKILSPLAICSKFYYYALLSTPLINRGYARHFKVLRNSIIPLPPLAEQKRIVAKINQLMACCDKLEAELSAAEDYRRRLARTLLAI